MRQDTFQNLKRQCYFYRCKLTHRECGLSGSRLFRVRRTVTVYRMQNETRVSQVRDTCLLKLQSSAYLSAPLGTTCSISGRAALLISVDKALTHALQLAVHFQSKDLPGNGQQCFGPFAWYWQPEKNCC